LALDLSDTDIAYGQSARVSVHLGAFDDTDSRSIKIYAKRAGGTAHLLVTDVVDDAGDLTIRVNPKVNTSYWATWDGDARYNARKGSAHLLTVHVIATGRLRGYAHVIHGIHFYNAGDTARYIGKVVPNHAGKRLLFSLQKRTNNGWASVDAAYFKIRKNGTVGVYLVNLKRNVVYRLSVYLPADGDHGADRSSWSMLKFA
jgi:hypothetical protein